MSFGEKLKACRKEKQMQQKRLAELSGVSLRSIQNWESGTRRPSNLEAVRQVAQVLEVSVSELIEERELYVLEAAEKGGSGAARDVEALVTELAGLFAGGTLQEEEKDGVMAALNEAYWRSKEINKKYAPKNREQA